MLCPDLAEGICSPQVNENRLRVAAKDKRNDGHPGHEIIFEFFSPIFDVVKTTAESLTASKLARNRVEVSGISAVCP